MRRLPLLLVLAGALAVCFNFAAVAAEEENHENPEEVSEDETDEAELDSEQSDPGVIMTPSGWRRRSMWCLRRRRGYCCPRHLRRRTFCGWQRRRLQHRRRIGP